MGGSGELADLAMDALREREAGRPAQFTSDLSVDELILVHEAGFEPLGLVVGSSIYHIGYQFTQLSQSQELTVLTRAMYQARGLAMRRLTEEARQLGADGVVGVRLEVGPHEWGQHVSEFVAIGTAVRSTARGEFKVAAEHGSLPFTSDLSGNDFWTLIQAGYRPLAMVMGSCVYHVAYQGLGSWFGNIGRNVEQPNFTEAIYQARELAMGRMQREAEQYGAEGIVGVDMSEKSHAWGGHTIEFYAVGTAVKPMRLDHEIQKPKLVLTLDR
jgi:uncharacterized protein YbjQ (UPF0145 family)